MLPNASREPGEGNGWLQTGLAIAMGYYPEDDVTWTKILTSLNRCCVSPACPLIFRSPFKRNSDDEQECDDYYGALLVSKPWAKEILEYGRKHFWILDVHEKGRWRFFFARFPSFVPFVKLCAGEELNGFERLLLNLSIYWDGFFRGKADRNMKAYCVVSKAKAVAPKASLYWHNRIIGKYGSVQQSFEEYFGKGHPLTASV